MGYTYNSADQLTLVSNAGNFPGSTDQPPSTASGAWSNAAAGSVSDDTYATAAPAKNQSLTEQYAGFGLDAIPSDATINSVSVDVEWAVDAGSAQATLSAQGYIGASPTGTPLTDASDPTADTVESFSLPGLTRDDLVNGPLAIQIGISRANGSSFTARLDAITVHVAYTSHGVAYGYDANGNQLSAGGSTSTYDRANRLLSTTSGTQVWTYTYAGDGLRLSATPSTQTLGPTTQQATPTQSIPPLPYGGPVAYQWDRNQAIPQLAAERDPQGNALRTYTYGIGHLSMTSSAGTTWYHSDGLGSVTDVTDGSGASQQWWEYEPYGQVRESGGTAPQDMISPAPFLFAGEQQDPTGLYYLRARQYDPGTGRFLTTDPVVAAVGDPYVASYVYARGNPVRLVDPSGAITGGEDAHAGQVEEIGWWLALQRAAILTGSVGVAGTAGALAGSALAESARTESIDTYKWVPKVDPQITRAQLELERRLAPTHLGTPGGGMGGWPCKGHERACVFGAFGMAGITALVAILFPGRADGKTYPLSMGSWSSK